MTATKPLATAALAVLLFTSMPLQAADLPEQQQRAHCGGYVTVPLSMAVSTARGAILSSSLLHAGNPLRAELGPHHYIRLYDPLLDCEDARPHRTTQEKRR